MRNFGSRMSALCCIALAVMASACSLIPRGAVPTGPDAKIISDTVRQTQEQVALGQYKKALETYANAYNRHHLRELRQRYARDGEQIRNTADAACQRKDYAEAGTVYRILFESGITTRDFAASLSFDDEYLNGQINVCSKALTEYGLMRYREEKLDEAISAWEKVLAFDPDNKAVMKAIDTAARQLQNLKSIK